MALSRISNWLLAAISLGAPPSFAEQQYTTIERPNGTPIHYTLDVPDGLTLGIIILAQGSGCAPGAQSTNLQTVRDAFPEYAALIVEKPGISWDEDITDGYSDCPQAFFEQFTLSQRVNDYRAVLSEIKSRPDIGHRLVLFGGSEGGLAVARLSTLVDPTAIILLSGATGLSFEEMVLSSVPEEGKPTVKSGMDAARANPDSSTVFAGSSQKFWADVLDYNPKKDLLSAEAPILLINGGRDPGMPDDVRGLLPKAFAESGNCNLTYWEFPALDHGMRDPKGVAHMVTVAKMSALWVGAEKPNC